MSDLRCRPGDLAVVVETYNFPENIGTCVDVIAPNVDPKYPDFEWVVRIHGPMTDVAGYAWPAGTIGPAKDSTLKPIRPPAPEKKTEALDELVI